MHARTYTHTHTHKGQTHTHKGQTHTLKGLTHTQHKDTHSCMHSQTSVHTSWKSLHVRSKPSLPPFPPSPHCCDYVAPAASRLQSEGRVTNHVTNCTSLDGNHGRYPSVHSDGLFLMFRNHCTGFRKTLYINQSVTFTIVAVLIFS